VTDDSLPQAGPHRLPTGARRPASRTSRTLPAAGPIPVRRCGGSRRRRHPGRVTTLAATGQTLSEWGRDDPSAALPQFPGGCMKAVTVAPVRPDQAEQALRRAPDDIKVVMEFAQR
jgi:hypothetical protein